MKEAKLSKFYLARYFFLVLGILQWVCAVILTFEVKAEKGLYTTMVLTSLGFIFILLNYFIFSNLKRVAIGKNGITVRYHGNIKKYEWSDVKFIKAIPYLKVAKLRLKGKSETIYFLTFPSMPHPKKLFSDYQ